MESFAGYIDNIEAKNKELREEIAILKQKLVDKNDYINKQRVIISGYTKALRASYEIEED
mgnify:FL=1